MWKSRRLISFIGVGVGVGLLGVVAGYQRRRERGEMEPFKYHPVRISKVEQVGQNLWNLHLIPLHASFPHIPAVSSIYIKHQGMQIERPYTPVKSSPQSLELLVRVYPQGEMSRYLVGHKEGDLLEVRGPINTFKAPEPDHSLLMVILSWLNFMGWW